RRRASWRRAVLAPGEQLRHRLGAQRGLDHRLRGADAGGQLVVLPAAQARRGPPRPGEPPGGDLLLRDARRRLVGGSAGAAQCLWLPTGLRHERPADQRPGRGPQRRRCPGPARLARARDGAARLRHVLPERDGGPGCPARVADHRRPRSCLGPADVGRPEGRPPVAVRRVSVSERVQLTVAQAVVRFLAQQYSERDGVHRRLVEGCFGIFGHGNIAGLGQALMEMERAAEGEVSQLRYFQCRNEQAMVHTAVGFSRMRNRLQTLACTTSVGPGATNLVTGAAVATVNRIPVLLLPGDVFATRATGTVLQQLESPRGHDVSVNAGAVTIALPQDVQAEAWDWPVELFEARVWHVGRPPPETAVLDQAVAAIRASKRPLVVAGGGVGYSEATDALRQFAESTGIPVAETQAGKGSLAWDHPQSVGAIGATGTTAANTLAAEADLVVGIGTRWSDFTTASMSAFANPAVRFVNINIAELDGHKLCGLSVVADAREALQALTTQLAGWRADAAYTRRASELAAAWDAAVAAAYDLEGDPDAVP